MMTLNVRRTDGSKFTVEVPSGGDADFTVRQLQEVIAAKCELAADNQRLVWRGKILKETGTLAGYGKQPLTRTCPPPSCWSGTLSPDEAKQPPSVLLQALSLTTPSI